MENNENKKLIRFIDSDYKELFRIPDGESIKVFYPPGDDRGTLVRKCQFIDEMHVKVGNEIYHSCQWAERMEAIGARYEPQNQLQKAKITPFSKSEIKFFTYNREENNSCIGHISGGFGNDGERFHCNWNDRENGRNTDDFQAEMQSVVYALRHSVLKNRTEMLDFCKSHPKAKLPNESNFEIYGFKLKTDTRQYFIRCFAENDAHFIAYAYDKIAPILKQNKDKPSILAQLQDNKTSKNTLDEKKDTPKKSKEKEI